MGLIASLRNAVSGLQVNQAQMDIISRNVANAGTVGYTRRVLTTQETSATGITAGAVRETEVNRILDRLLQKQLRTETSGATFSETRADYLQRVDSLFGQPGSSSGLNALFDGFSTSLQQLAADPASTNMRAELLAKAQTMTGGLNQVSQNVQLMRSEIEARIADDAQHANGLLDGIENTTKRLNEVFDSSVRAGLLDERDRYIDELSNYFDLQVVDNGSGNFNIYTTGGGPLFIEGRHLRLQFDARLAVSADSVYDPVKTASGVGHLEIADPIGGAINLTNTGAIRSGSFAALIDLRDNVLVETQNQLDEFAAAMATTLGNYDVDGTAVTAGAAQGFDLDLNALQPGNVITLETTTTPGGAQQRYSFIVSNDPASLPFAAGATADPNDIEVGIDFSGGFAAAIAAIGTALGAPFAVSDQGGGVMRILDDGAGNTRDVNALSARATAMGLTDEGLAVPLFVDNSAGNQIYTGSLDGSPQKRGFARGIAVNQLILNDPSRLVVYQTAPSTTNSGDPARPTFLRDQLQGLQLDFTPSTAISGSTSSYRGTAKQFLDRVISAQTQAASNAGTLAEGQQVVVSALRERAADVSGVETDRELGELIEIQNIYSANARIVSAVRDMFDILLRI